MTSTILDILILLIGIYFLYGVWFKPDIFWERRRIQRTRGILGDQGTIWMYAILGAVMTIVGLIGTFGVFG